MRYEIGTKVSLYVLTSFVYVYCNPHSGKIFTVQVITLIEKKSFLVYAVLHIIHFKTSAFCWPDPVVYSVYIERALSVSR